MFSAVERGFTLLEQVIALSILAIGLTGAAGLFGEALRQLSTNAGYRAAGMLAEELLNQLYATTERTPGGESISCTIGVDTCFRETEIEDALTDWRLRLLERLPGADAELAIIAAARTTTYRLRIEWRSRRSHTESQQFELLLRR